jgi:hypothetical protein
VTERVAVQYEFNIFNVTNTTSMDVPQDQTQIRQNDACSNSALPYGNCAAGYVNYGQIATSASTADQQSTLANLDQKPYFTGSGKSTQIPTTIAPNTVNAQGAIICTSYNADNSGSCPNNGANFGSVTGTIGGNRAVTMALHVTF